MSRIKNPNDRANSSFEIDIYWWWIIEKSKMPKNSYQDSLVSISEKICKDAGHIKMTKSRANKILIGANYAATTLIELNRMYEARKYLSLAKDQIKHVGFDCFPVADFYAAKGDFELANKLRNEHYLDSALYNYNKALLISKKLDYGWLSREKLYPRIAQVYKEKKDLKRQLLFLELEDKEKDKFNLRENYNSNLVKQKLYSKKESVNGFKLRFIFLAILILFLVLLFFLRKRLTKKKNSDRNLEIPGSGLIKIDTKNLLLDNLLELLTNDNDSFLKEFLNIYPDFNDKLKSINPDLKESDVEFCALIKMNLDTKQIAQAKKTSVKSVESKKYRIRKKLGIPSETDMNVWMSKL